ncbi:MAG: extracellular solute-binding protein [Phycisphaerales bacterium JB063]
MPSDPRKPGPQPRTGPDVSRRSVLRGIGAGGAGLALGAAPLLTAGCTERPDRYTPDGRLILSYWEKWTGSEGDAAQAVVDAYNASQDRVFVKRTTISDMQNKLMLATAGGNPPDIAGTWSWVVIPYAEKNALTPLDGYMRDLSIERDDFIPVFWDMCTHRGYLWAMPSTPASLALHYNRALLRAAYEHDPAYFDRHGLDPHAPPADIAGFEKLNDILTLVEVNRNGKPQRLRYTDLTPQEQADPDESFRLIAMGHSPYEPDWYVPTYWLFFGGEVWDGTSNVTPDDPGLLAWLRWIESYPKRFGPDNLQRFSAGLGQFGTPQNPFMTQTIAMQLQGPWTYNFINAFAPHLEWDVQAFPSLDPVALPNASLTECDVFVIPNGAKHPEEAARYIAFASSQTGQEILNLGQRKFSARQQTSETFFRDHPNPHIQTFIDLARSPNARATPAMGIWKQYDEELRQATSSVFQLTKTPEEALEIACARAQWKLDREAKRWERVGEARLEEWERVTR